VAKKSRRDHRWKKLRLRILSRDAHTCHYCGDTANEVDHIVPLKRGGSDDPDNLVACCRTCNIRKKDQEVGVFLAHGSTPPVFQGNLSPRAASVIPENPFVTETTPAVN
jgi:5-methylcytosine-specific restriction endonuclease McrA